MNSFLKNSFFNRYSLSFLNQAKLKVEKHLIYMYVMYTFLSPKFGLKMDTFFIIFFLKYLFKSAWFS